MKQFEISYFEKKDRLKLGRTANITLPSATGRIEIDAKKALGTFINGIGSLSKYEVTKIQELDDNNLPVGEPLTPTEGSSVIPISK